MLSPPNAQGLAVITTSVVLAAGRGTRMGSDLPKVLHLLHGKPLIHYSVSTTTEVTGRRPILVVGFGADRVRDAVGDRAFYVHQSELKGTGHAVQQAEKILKGRTDAVLVTFGDMPLLTVDSLKALVECHASGGAVLTMLTVIAEDPRGFGRIVRGADGGVQAIVEEAVAAPGELAIRELNVGAYVFDESWLWDALDSIRPSPKGEYYLTDLVEIANRQERRVRALVLPDEGEAIGINTTAHLAEAAALLAQKGRLHPA